MTEFFQEIEQYLAGNLAPEQVTALEDRLSWDEPFAKEVHLYMKAKASIKAARDQQLRESLQEIAQELMEEEEEIK